jgi:osmotically-inducible protein OsmY
LVFVVTYINQLARCARNCRSSGTLPLAAVLVTAWVATACSSAPRRTEAERIADAGIATQIEATLLADPSIYARHIDVTVDRGVAHLGGFVWSPQDFAIARRDAESVAGVIRVQAQMELVRGGVAGSR